MAAEYQTAFYTLMTSNRGDMLRSSHSALFLDAEARVNLQQIAVMVVKLPVPAQYAVNFQ